VSIVDEFGSVRRLGNTFVSAREWIWLIVILGTSITPNNGAPLQEGWSGTQKNQQNIL